MFVTKKFLPRRTFLRGMGVAVSLPLLDAMVPALTALARAQARPRTRFGAIYVPNGAIMEQWIPETRRRRVRLQADPQADRAVQGPDGRGHEPDALASGQPGGRPRRQRRRLPHRRVAEAHRGRRRARQHHDRSGGGAADRSGHAVPVARGRHRGLHRLRRRLLARVQLRLPQHDVVEHAVDAAADGHQPAGRVRAHVRPGRQPGAARGADPRRAQHARLDIGRGAAAAARARRARPSARHRVSRQPARDRAPHPARRVAQRRPTSRSTRRWACPTRSRST